MVLGDGAYGTLLAPHLRGGETADELCVREPGRVVEAHLDYTYAGARAIQTNSFLAWRFGERRRSEIYRAALECARDAAAAYSGPDEIEIRATIGPAGSLPRAYYRDLEQLLEDEVQAVLCETVTDADTASAFAAAWHEVAAGAPARAIMTCSISPSLGYESWRWLGAFEMFSGELLLGLNCCEGPAGLREPLQLLAERSAELHVAPSAGLPSTGSSGEPVWPLAPQAWAEQVAELVADLPVASVGGCCGSTPESIDELRQALDAGA